MSSSTSSALKASLAEYKITPLPYDGARPAPKLKMRTTPLSEANAISCTVVTGLIEIASESKRFFWLVFYKINFENSGPSGPFIIHKNTF